MNARMHTMFYFMSFIKLPIENRNYSSLTLTHPISLKYTFFCRRSIQPNYICPACNCAAQSIVYTYTQWSELHDE